MTSTAPQRSNLASLLDDLGQRPRVEAFALRTPYRRFAWSAGEVRIAALRLAERIGGLGVGVGDRVILLGPPSPEWATAFFGLIASGAVIVPLDEDAPGDFVRKVAAKTSAKGTLAAARHAAAVPEAAPLLATLESLRELRGSPGGRLPDPHRASPTDTAEIVFTSGTTADPKGVELTHANLLATLGGIEAGFRKRERKLRPFLPFRILCLVPLSHMFGQALGILVPILLRSTAVFSSTLQPARLLGAIRREGPIAIVAVPRMLSGLREALMRDLARGSGTERFDRRFDRAQDRAWWRRVLLTRDVRRALGWRTWCVVVGGAALDRESEEFWTRCGFAVIQGYGMTEAAPIISVRNPLEAPSGTIGKPIGGIEVRVAEDGEVLVRGANVMKGYYRDPDATAEALRDGWLRTGDLVERDAEGRLYYRGRKKDLIVLPDGRNVVTSDVEGALESVEGVREAVAYAAKGVAGEEVHAAVLATDPATAPERIRAAANARLLPHQRIRRVVLWEEPDFPRTATGKVRRFEVAAARRAARPEAAAASAGSPARRVAAALERLRPGTAPGARLDARLDADLGLGSLEVIELLDSIEETYDVALPDDAIGSALTVGDLERLASGSGSEEPRSRIRPPRWARKAPIRWLRGLARVCLVRPLFSYFVDLEVRDAERLAAVSTPCLIVANHTSFLDVPAVVLALPPALRSRVVPAMAVETLPEHFDPRGAPLWRRLRSSALYALAAGLFAAYPLPQTRGFRPSLEYTGELLDAGLCPLVFPEGQMTRTGEMLAFKSGIGLLAIETRAPVLPLHLDGLGKILPPDGRWPRRGAARARVGAMIEPQDPGLDASEVARRIEEAVRALAPAEPPPRR